MSGAGIKLDGAPFTTTAVQNVSGVTSATGFFFLNGWASHPGPGLQYVQPGWTVVGEPTWVVASTNPGSETITITGGQFLNSSSYQFTGPGGMTIQGGVTITA